MLLLWNQWIDENATQLSISHQGCECVCGSWHAGAHVSAPPSRERHPSRHHLFIWQPLLIRRRRYEKRSERKNNRAVRALSHFVPTELADQRRLFKATSLGSTNLWRISVMQLFITLPEGAPLPFNKQISEGVKLQKGLLCYLAVREWSDLSGEVWIQLGAEINSHMITE